MKIGWLLYDRDYPEMPPTLHTEQDDFRSGRWVHIVYAEVVQ